MPRRYVRSIRCKAKAKTTRRRCDQPAVKGKDVCRWHGGLTPIKHGLYSKYAPVRLSALIEENRTHPGLLDLRERIALIDALAQDFLENVQKAGDKVVLRPEERESLARLAKQSADTVVRLSEVEEGLKLVVRVETFQSFVGQVLEVLRAELRGHPDLLERIAIRLGAMEGTTVGPRRLKAALPAGGT